jgi:hypothetical protein
MGLHFPQKYCSYEQLTLGACFVPNMSTRKARIILSAALYFGEKGEMDDSN